MSEITARDIQRLRQQAGVGMMDAKKALTDSAGDYDGALDLLRERGLAKAAKRSGREAGQGSIGSYIHIQNGHPVMGVLVDLACETDFVAKSPEFNAVAVDIALHIAWGNPLWVTKDQVDAASLAKEQDLIEREARASGKPEAALERIVDGKLAKFYEENVLYEQLFANKEKFEGTVGEMVGRLAAKMGENISIRRFSRVSIGDGE